MMTQRNRLSVSRSRLLGTGLMVFGAASMLSSGEVRAFSEELFTDPVQSTIHYSLVKALATCAGYEDLAEVVATYSQLTDLTDNEAYNGSVCGITLPSPPDNPQKAAQSGATLEDLVPGWINGCARWKRVVYPIEVPGEGMGCFSDRFQAFGVFFHLPTQAQLAKTRTWAFTEGIPLLGDGAAAYGGITQAPLTWQCIARWTDIEIETGNVLSGTPESLGIYLHSLADTGSHHDCIDHVFNGPEPLDLPTHHGMWGVDQCSFFHHIDEFQEFETDIGEAPIYRTLATAVGQDAMEWLYNGNLPYDNDYDFIGLYKELLAWRDAFPSYFVGRPAPIPMDLDDPDYQAILEMTQHMIVDHSDGGAFLAPLRIEDAQEIQSYCELALGQ